ncbi:MAG: PAS domain S-box protein [Nitrospira sp.]|nr:PAS domain S-box protein [Nitrospira sp.]
MFDVSTFRLQDMTACSAALRQLGTDASSIEIAADRITRYLYTTLTTGPDEDPACVLVRLFKTHPYDRLSPELQALADARLGGKPANPGMKCLTLLASTGAVEGWNHPAQSSRFRVIPLSGPDALAKLPMFSQLFAQFHIDLPFLEQAGSSLLMDQYATTFNAFHVPQALGSPYVPGQTEFVVPFGIQSVFGFGGLLATGEMFTVILFANIPVTKDTADLCKAFALSTKLTLAPFEHNRLILPPTVTTSSVDQALATNQLASLQDRVATLESILAVQEHAVAIQSDRLAATLADEVRHGRELQEQSLRFETLSATSPVGIFETDANGSYLYTNDAWRTISGLSLAESLGEGWSRAIFAEDRPTVSTAWSQTAKTGGEFSLEFRMQRPDGTIRWVHARSRPLRNATDQVVGHVGTTEDITERKQKDAALRKSEARLREAQAMAHLGNWELDLVNDRLLWSDEIFRIFEIDQAQFSASYEAFLNAVHPDDRALVNEAYTRSVQNRTPYEIVHRLLMPDGRIKYVQERGGTHYDREGRPQRSAGTVQDITERREDQLQLQHSQALLNAVFDHLPNMVFVKDAKTLRFVEFNKAGERLTGFSREELLGKSDYDFFPQEEADFFTGKDRAVLASGAMLEIPEEEIQTKHRGIRILQTKKLPLYDTAGVPQYLLGISEDITDRRAAEVQFTQVFESSYVGMLMVADDGRITLANPQIEQTFGYRRDELIGQPVEILLPKRFRTTHHGQRMSFVASGASRPMAKGRELYGCRKDGREFPLEIGLTPVNTPQGHQVLASITDITDRKKSEASRFRLQQAVNHAQDGTALLDDTGEYIYMNPAHAAIYGYTVDELLGHSWKDLYHSEWASMIEQLYLPVLHADGQWQGEVVGKKKTGDAFHVDLSLTLLEEPGTGRQTILCTCRDITLRKRMERDLITAKEAAEAGIRTKSEFLATMSHEIRTPMNGVIGMTGLLLDTPLTPEQREYAETVRRSGEALLAIINDILDFSKIEAGKLALEIIEFDLRTTVEETLDLLAEPAQRKDLEVVGLVDGAVPADVKGDPGRLRQILTNLLGNAIKFTERGEVVLALSVLKESDRSVTLRFTVTDTGVGITPEGRARLFQSFSQADGSTTRRFGGTGLGLAISKQLVELMRGEIGADSLPGSGSTFWFTIELERPPHRPAPPTPAQDLAGLRVCLIDDNATNRLLLEHHARAWGMTHASAEDGPAGLALIQDAHQSGHPFDLAIIDMQMPGMDGMRLAEAINTATGATQTRLVLLTSLTRRGDAKLAQQRGFSAYLTKPIRQHQLYDSLRLVMGRTPAKTPQDSSLITLHSLAEAHARIDGRLLLAEDNVINQKVAVKMLEKLGCRVDVVADGREAVEACSRIPYALIFMDCQMPEMDGFEATRRIRQREGTARHTPIIAMTANAMASDREQCLAAGMDDYLSKPVHSVALADILARWVPAPGSTANTAESRPLRPVSDDTDATPPGRPDGCNP